MANQARIDQYISTIVTTAMAENVPQVNAKLIASQGRHESGDFSSHVFITDNNAFGMKVPSVRKSPFIERPSTIVMTAEGSTPYAHYRSLSDSTRDVVHWLRFNKIDWAKTNTPATYAAFLKSKGYYGDSQENYTARLSALYARIKDIVFKKPALSAGILLAAMALTGIGFYMIVNRKKLA